MRKEKVTFERTIIEHSDFGRMGLEFLTKLSDEYGILTSRTQNLIYRRRGMEYTILGIYEKPRQPNLERIREGART